jgi:SAM-dependent methyltransferase
MKEPAKTAAVDPLTIAKSEAPSDACIGPGDGNEWHTYLTRRPPLTTDIIGTILKRDENFFSLIDSVRTNRGRILEAGCGTGARLIAYSVATGAHVTLLDRDPRVLELARSNAKRVGANNVEFRLGNLFDLSGTYREGDFETITHHGVLEHYPPDTIRLLLEVQLQISVSVVFGIPVLSEFNRARFAGDGISRNLWPAEEWVNNILGDFRVEHYETVRVDKDELLAVVVSRARQSVERSGL